MLANNKLFKVVSDAKSMGRIRTKFTKRLVDELLAKHGARFTDDFNKNKLVGDKDTKPELRHGNQAVLIQPHIARFKEMV